MRSQTFSPPRTTPRRAGAFLLVAIVCLIVLTAVMGLLLKTSLQRQKQQRSFEHQVQVRWLAESELDRAAARLRADPEFSEETRQIAAEEISGAHAAEVSISVNKSETDSHPEITVVVTYPVGSPEAIRQTRKLIVPESAGEQQ
jgi:type II secretory pathway pseudopilin PulG